MVQWVIGLIPHGGSIELFLIPASAHDIVAHVVVAAGFLFRYLSGPLSYAGHHITINKICWNEK